MAEDHRLWQYWWLADGSLLLFVTYNTDTEAKLTRDAATVYHILGSLRCESDMLAS